eukprot:SAG31_NODE_12001_length_978_cov_1.566553_2_plen_174_part_01
MTCMVPSCMLFQVLSAATASQAAAPCPQMLAGLCGQARSIGGDRACLQCCGQHQRDLKVAGCTNGDTQTFCLAESNFQFGAAATLHATRSPVHASPITLEDTVLFSTLEPDCAFYRLNVSSGSLLWRFDTPRRDTAHPPESRCGLRASAYVSRPPSGGHHIHIGTDNNSFIALD